MSEAARILESNETDFDIKETEEDSPDIDENSVN